MARPGRLYSWYRFATYLLHEFRWPLSVFTGTVLLGGLALWFGYGRVALSYPRACHTVFAMIFLEQTLDFPREWYLAPLFFIVPIVGLGAVADSLVRMGYLIFTSKQKLQEWQVMQAGLVKDHFVVVGTGKMGLYIIRELLALRESVVAIDRSMDAPLVADVLDLGVPVIHGDARHRKVLEQAGVARARAIILATGDDLANLDAALTARQIRPEIRTVVRMFDDTLATKVAGPLHLHPISTPATSAPAFIAAAQGRSVYQSFSLDGSETLHVADVSIGPESPLLGRSVADIQAECGVNIVMLRRAGQVTVNPEHAVDLRRDDRMVVIAPVERLAQLERPRERR
jgi:Trk K+ transport system NAD-binding subunit